MHPHPSHLASPQKPLLTPPPFPAHPALNAASPEPLEAHDVTEKTTKKPNSRNLITMYIKKRSKKKWNSTRK
jgi:hypothetical protein